MRCSTLLLTLILSVAAYAQSQTWIAFQNDSSELTGFKDAQGNVKIAPRFMGYTMARKWDHIIAVTEEINGQFTSYYLTKSGRTIGYDSLFTFDNGADCESEGFIRFKDPKTDKIGLFDQDGNIAIPAIYDAMSNMQNSMVWALKGAQKEYWDQHKESGCNHYSWKGGTEILLDRNNSIIVEEANHKSNLNRFTAEIQAKASTDTIRKSFRTTNGQYISFIDHQQEFNQWLQQLISKLSRSKLNAISMDSIIHWNEQKNEWITTAKETFMEKQHENILKRLQPLSQPEADYFITENGLNPFIYQSTTYMPYFNNCGEALQERYPIMNLIINYENEEELTQDQFEFLRTEKGYKLIGMSLR